MKDKEAGVFPPEYNCAPRCTARVDVRFPYTYEDHDFERNQEVQCVLPADHDGHHVQAVKREADLDPFIVVWTEVSCLVYYTNGDVAL